MHNNVDSFIVAAENGDFQSVAMYLIWEMPSGVQDAQGRTALHEAVVGCHTEIVAMLLEHGANVDAQDLNGITPLMEAASVGEMALIEKLITAGADLIRFEAHGDRAADYASAQGFDIAARRLTP
ncbi:MAG TPA: ankyrin repeat domain-containing protein [Opitutaceae bacterium]|nr:ankyrin repeat domain-containing protein [Opitutaceae bacterium]